MSRLLSHYLALVSGILFSPCKASESIEAIAFGSCLKQTRPQPIWESVRACKPDVFVLLGDNIYGDTRDMKKLESRWDAFAAVPDFKRLRGDCRLLAIWDDHDYGENDAGREFPKKAESQKLFLDFLGEPEGSKRRKTPGIYDSVTFGPEGKRVQFVLLDTRYFRSPLKRAHKREQGKGPYEPNDSEKAELLGEGQWQWLGESSSRTSGPSYHRIEHSSSFNVSWLGNLGKFSKGTAAVACITWKNKGERLARS